MKKILLLWLIVIVSTFLVWLPFFSTKKMTTVFANFDGPNYLVIAKCWYDKECIGRNFSLPQPLEYYPAHFPGYPLLISIANWILPGWWALLIANLIATGAMVTILYLLLEKMNIKESLWLAIIILFLPARGLILRSVGAPETFFTAAVLASILFFREKKYLITGLFLALAQFTKTPAIILFAAYGLQIIITDGFKVKKWLEKWPLLLGPMTILLVFLFFKVKVGDFWAYFHSGDNFHLFFPPFQSLLGGQSWLAGNFWLEDIIYVYLLGGVAVAWLVKKYQKDIIAIFPALFYFSTLFVAHRDIARYSFPTYPFWIIAFSPLLQKKEFKIVFLLILPAIYLYATNFISYNLTPVADWTPYF